MLRKFSPSRASRNLAVSSTLAIAASLVVTGTGARAQAFLGTPTLAGGNATVTTGTNTTTVTVNSPSAVINWTPTDNAIGGGTINFQPNGTTATFVNNPSATANFAVLNNILPTDTTRAVQFNGTIVSQLQTAAGGSSTGGTVYFYTPGGILVGPSAVINVGNLGLTANPITYDSAGNFGATGSVINDGTQTVSFGQATTANAQVFVSSGAQINANSTDGSYVAMVAPIVQNTGTINVNGNAALVAADAATITFQPSGLYSVTVDAGTSSTGATLFNNGTITGPAANSSQGGPAHRIYLVTAPKNTLITLAVGQGSNLGFDIAGAADVFGNTVVLSGGYNVTDGSVDVNVAPISSGVGGAVNTLVTGSNVTSALTATASGTASATPFNATSPSTFASDLSLSGLVAANLSATNGGSVTVNGNASVVAIDKQAIAPLAGSVSTGGSATIFATQGSSIRIKGASTVVSADSTGGTSTTDGVNAGSGTGGFASIQAANGGTITIDNSLFVSADGTGGFGNPRTGNSGGGTGRGGSVNIQATDTNAHVTIGGSLYASADGFGGGGFCATTCTAEAGDGFGGTVQMFATRGGVTPGGGSSIDATGAFGNSAGSGVRLSAAGYGSEAETLNGGNGTGGNLFVTVDPGNAINLSDTFYADALGAGGGTNGTQKVGGIGTGGLAQVNLNGGGSLSAAGLLTLTAHGEGGYGAGGESNGSDSSGGLGKGGTAVIFASGGNALLQGGATIDAQGIGGGSSFNTTIGVGGIGQGGSARIDAVSAVAGVSGTITLGGVTNVAATGQGGSGFPGGQGLGGTAEIFTRYGTIAGADVVVDSSGVGGLGNPGGAGGTGTGGSTYFQARNNAFGASTISVASADLVSNGQGGAGGSSTRLTMSGGAGGNGEAGTVFAAADAGDGHLTVSGALQARADAIGGNGGDGADNADAVGSSGGAGGAAFGYITDATGAPIGSVTVGTISGAAGTTSNGSASFGSVTIEALAQGGDGGNGGNAFTDTGLPGDGGNGGNALDGAASLIARGSPVTVMGTASLRADAIGGDGGTGAFDGVGGNALVGGLGGGTGVSVLNRNGNPAQRGTLTAKVIVGQAAALGGIGSTDGISTMDFGPIGLTIVNGDLTANTFGLVASADNNVSGAAPGFLNMNNGTANIASQFVFSSTGPITVNLDTSTISASSVVLSGSDWILPTAPQLAGTINAASDAQFLSGNNIVTFANVNVRGPFAVNALGNLQLGNVTTIGDFFATSGGTTILGSVTTSANANTDLPSEGNVDVQAGNAITIGGITGPGYVSIVNSGNGTQGPNVGSIAVGAIQAGRDVDLLSNASISAQGSIQAGANVDIEAMGSVAVRDISAGLVNPSTTPGDTFEIVVRSGGPLMAGNLASQTDIGLLSQQSAALGALTGRDIQVLAQGAIVTGPIASSARVLLADASMAALGTSSTGYDPNPAFNAVPIRTSGSVTVNGAVTATQFFTAAAGQSFTSGDISTARGPILIDSGASIRTANIAAPSNVVLSAAGTTTVGTVNAAASLLVLSSGTVSTQAIRAGGLVLFADQSAYQLGLTSAGYSVGNLISAIVSTDRTTYVSPGAIAVGGDISSYSLLSRSAQDFSAGSINASPGTIGISSGGSISVGSLVATDFIFLGAAGNIKAGDASAGLGADTPDQPPGYFVSINAGGNLAVGNIQARNVAILSAGADSMSGSVTARDVLGLVHGVAAYGPITATGRVLLADQSMYALGNVPSAPFQYDINQVFSAGPVASAGPITVNGAVSAGQFFSAATAQGFTSGSITTGTDLMITAGGPVMAGPMVSGGFVDVSSGALNAGPITARRYVRVNASGPVTIGGAIQAGAQVQLSSTGSITTGDITAGFAPASTAAGDFFDINLDAGGALTTGNLQTTASVVLHSLSTIQSQNVNANFLGALGGSSVTTGSINANGVLFASQSFYTGQTTAPFVGSTLLSTVNSQQPINPVNVGTGGSIAINGSVSGNLLNAYSAANISVAGPVQETGIAVLRAAGNIAAGNLQGGSGAQAIANGNIVVGNVTGGPATAQPVSGSTTTSVVVVSGGSIVAGNLRSANNVLLTAQQTAQTGSITTGDLLALVHGAASVGPVTATGRVLMADSTMTSLGNTTQTVNGVARPLFDPNLVFNATPISSAGPITINGTVSAASLTTASAGSFASGAITTTNFVDVTTGGDATVTGAIQSGQETSISAGGGIMVGDIKAGAPVGAAEPVPFSIGLVANGGPVVAGNLSGSQSIGIGAAGSVTTGTLSGANLLVGAGSTITTGAISMSGKALLASVALLPLGGTPGSTTPYDATPVFAATPIAAPGAITINGAVNTGDFFHAATLQGFTSGAITSGADLSVSAGGAVQAGALGAGGPITINADSLTLGGGISTPGSLSISTVQSLSTQDLVIGGNIALSSQNALSTGNVTSSNGSVALTAGTTLTAGTISAATSAMLSSIGAMQTGSITAGSQVTISADSFVLNSPSTPGTIVTTGGGLSISTTKALVLPSLTINGDIAASSSTALTAGDVVSSIGSATLSSGGPLTVGSIKAATTISVNAKGAVTAGNAASMAGITANGNITISGGDVTVLAGNSTSSKAALTITGTGALNLDTAFGTTSVSLSAGTNLRITGSSANGAVTEVAGGSIDTGSINAGGISITAGTTFQSGNLLSSKGLSITSAGDLATALVTANGGAATLNSGGTLTAGVINTAGGIALQSTGAAAVQGLTSSGAINFNSLSTFTNSGQTVSAIRVIGQSTGAMTLGNVTTSGGAGTVELASLQGSLTAGRISATTDIATIAAGGALTLGQVSGRDILLLASGNVQVGSVSAGAVINQSTGAVTGATGRVLIANSSAGPAGGKFGSFNYNTVFNSTGGAVISSNPPRTGGSVNVTGTVNAGTFGSYSQGAMTGQVINAFGSLEVESGGLVTVGQRWTSPDLSILSNDIAIQPSQVLQTITTTAGLNAGTTGIVTLASLNPNGAFIGDGLTAGQGYALSNAEVGLVQSGSLTIAAAAAPSLATTMTIGTLSLTGAQASNTQDGSVQFATGNPQTLIPSGTIRVTGAVTAKGFTKTGQLLFDTGTFELDNSAGSLAVTDSSNAMTGGISISANRIHIAAASILDKLRADPFYAGRIVDLNAPPSQPPAGPVLSASQLFFAPTQTLYIQNTGTAAAQAGFLVPLAGLTIETPSTQSTQAGQTASSASIVINGQFVGTPTNVTGSTAFMQFVQQTKLTGITADSQFNGCLLAAGTCGMATVPAPDLSTQIQVLQTPALPSAPAIVAAVQQASPEVTADPQQQEQTADKPTEAEQKEEKESKASAKAPIAPPAPMIDTRPLSPPVSVDEPVAGGGNPALFGIGTAPTPTEGGDK